MKPCTTKPIIEDVAKLNKKILLEEARAKALQDWESKKIDGISFEEYLKVRDTEEYQEKAEALKKSKKNADVMRIALNYKQHDIESILTVALNKAIENCNLNNQSITKPRNAKLSKELQSVLAGRLQEERNIYISFNDYESYISFEGLYRSYGIYGNSNHNKYELHEINKYYDDQFIKLKTDTEYIKIAKEALNIENKINKKIDMLKDEIKKAAEDFEEKNSCCISSYLSIKEYEI